MVAVFFAVVFDAVAEVIKNKVIYYNLDKVS